MKNMVAIGATCAVMKLDTTPFETLITNMFTKKGQKVVEMNIEALHQGYELMKDKLDTVNGDYLLEDSEGTPHLYMIGNDAIGLGAISAGSRFMAAYPITPASEIMEYMIANVPKVGGTVVQTEDEIAAANMAIANSVSDEELNPNYIIPKAFNLEVQKRVAEAVKDAAIKSGVATI